MSLVNKINFLVLSIFILFSSCEKNTNKALVFDWIGKELKLPSDSLKVNFENNEVFPKKEKLKIITFINVDCSECVSELEKWKILMNEWKNMQIGYIYILGSNEGLYSFQSLEEAEIKLKYPYFFDRWSSLAKINKITQNKPYKTFLLNENNKIVLIGNPIYNESIKILYNNYLKTKFL